MVLFSCFPAPIPRHKPKKIFRHSADCIHKKSQDHPQDLSSRGSSHSPISDATHASSPKKQCPSGHAEKLSRSSSFHISATASGVVSPDPKFLTGSCCEEHMHSSSRNAESLHVSCLKKSKSLGSRLDRERRFADVDTEDETVLGLSCANVHEVNCTRIFSTIDHNHSADSSEYKEHENVLHDMSGCSHHDEDTENVEPCKMHMGLNQDVCAASSCDQRQLDPEVRDELVIQADDSVCAHESNISEKHFAMQRSYSLTDMEDNRSCTKYTLARGLYGSRSRSSGDLLALQSSTRAFDGDNDGYYSRIASLKSGNMPFPHVSDVVSLTGHQHICEEKSGGCTYSVQSDHSRKTIGHMRSHTTNVDNFDTQNQLPDGHDSCRPTSSVRDNAIMQETNTESMEILETVNQQGDDFKEYPRHWWDGLSSKEFNVKRIEHWVSTIDIESSDSLEEVGECSSTSPETKEDPIEIGTFATKLDSRIPHVVQVANNYISTLGASSTSAQMANFGLPVIPQLSIFHSLRVVNLSGNAIVRITAGALPKGLHVLNLSKNCLSIIEGFRELTHLRVLDLSYNRIFRIGRGLASCASLKELYLPGNKISEVEGLHRLLKLNILDLSYNKISTAKCLGQLAANYSSLQALNLEGNPAQKNVGDEQLKKSLMSLLPHLVYLNRQPVKASSSKEASDRASRSISIHQFERGTRSDHKIARKGGHSSGISKTSGNGGLIQAVASSKQSKGHHHGRRPPSKSKVNHNQVNQESRLLGLHLTNSMRRSRSEGTMNVL